MLILLRHGRTAANAAGLLLGRHDPPLDETGVAQAAAAAVRLAGAHRVITSPLQRARQTADALGLPVTVDERWIELDYGELDGKPFGDVPSDMWQQWRQDPGFTPPGGESLVELGQRVRAACEELRDEVAERDVVVVSHVSPIKAAVAWAIGAGDELSWRLHLDPAAISRVVVGPRGTVLRTFNEVPPLD